MQIGKALLAKFGLYAPKSEIADAFAMRLDRINMRETRREVRQALFRGFAQSQAV
jgi:hypothetical protein